MTATTENKPSLAIPGKLPFEDYASGVNIGDLLKMLVNKGVLSVDDYWRHWSHWGQPSK